jgi:hypothetical protein
VFLKLKALLAPFGITRYYTDKAGVYQRHLPWGGARFRSGRQRKFRLSKRDGKRRRRL